MGARRRRRQPGRPVSIRRLPERSRDEARPVDRRLHAVAGAEPAASLGYAERRRLHRVAEGGLSRAERRRPDRDGALGARRADRSDQTGIIRGGGIVAYDWVQQIYAAGIKGSFDALAWNAYGPGAPEDEFPDSQGRPQPGTLPALVYLQTLLNTYDPGRPVWVTEINWSTCPGCVVDNLPGVDEATQADYLSRAWIYRRRYLAASVPVMFWFMMSDGPTTNWEDDAGLVHYDGSPKPAYGAFAGLAAGDPGQPASSTPTAARRGLRRWWRRLGGRRRLGRRFRRWRLGRRVRWRRRLDPARAAAPPDRDRAAGARPEARTRQAAA